ncbi:MAG: hypothetical protein JXQ87_10020 [Bacteroidia bacterium]
MKSRLFSVIFLLAVSLSFGKTDSTNYIHEFKRQGPVSIQLLWISTDAEDEFAEKATWLKAAIHGSTKKHNRNEFKALCEDYKIKWQLKSRNGMHQLGVTFAPQQYELATDLLNEVLNETSYRIKYIHEWRKQELFNFNYYKNDKDSLLKWWASGKEAYYKSLESKGIDAKGASLIDKLGRPQIVSSVGRINDDILFKRLEQIVKTEPNPSPNFSFDVELKERPSESHYLKEALFVKQANPIVTYASCYNMASQLTRMVNYWQFSFANSYGEFYLNNGVDAGATDSYIPNDDALKWALIQYDNWIAKNKNEALANAYFNLGIWDKEMLEQVEKDDFSVNLEYKTFSIKPKE